ncbi:MAG: transglutaminase domain-containing protein [Acidobacteria bacterium]|nr:transglutaminase domain-containing protein [Acidobacteriota bacterium]
MAQYAYDEDEDGYALSTKERPTEPDRTVDTDEGVDELVYFSQDEHRTHWTWWGGALYPFAPGPKAASDRSLTPVLELAVAAAEGQSSPFEAMRRIYRVANQRLSWVSATEGDVSGPDIEAFLYTPVPLTPIEVAALASPDTLGSIQASNGQCGPTSFVLSALARSLGVPTRIARSDAGDGACPPVFGWGSYHAWVEARLGSTDLPRHGGTTAPDGGSEVDALDHWYVFDATDRYPRCVTALHGEESIDPRQDYMRLSQLQLSCTSNVSTWDGVRKAPGIQLGFEPLTPYYDPTYGRWASSPGLRGVLGWGDVDFYSYEGGPGTVGFRQTSDGTVAAVLYATRGGFPVYRCDTGWVFDVAGSGAPGAITLPDHDVWGIAVVADTPDDPAFHGNAVDYELQFSP